MLINEKMNRIRTIADESKNVISECHQVISFKNDYIKTLDDVVGGLLNSPKPRLAVCGVYSAGKSTIINILCGKEVAEMAAQPQTDKVTEYCIEGSGYSLFDTPGVDAPIEHERITDDFIKKCNVIMFVISTKNAESEANYRKINEWMQYDRPLIIVINDKNGSINMASKEIEEIRIKIQENLKKSNYTIKNNYNVIAVNAKMALKSLNETDMEKKMKWMEFSNFNQLETMINNVMTGSLSIYKAPISEIIRILDEVESELSNYGSNDDNSLKDKLSLLEEERIRMTDSTIRQIKKSCADGKRELINAAMSNNDNESIQDTCTKVQRKIASDVDKSYRDQIAQLANVVNSSLNDYGIEMDSNGTININGNSFDLDGIVNNLINDPDNSDTFKSVIGGATLGEMLGTAAGRIATAIAAKVAAGAAAAGAAGGAAAGAAGGGIAATIAGLPLGPIGLIGGALGGLLVGRIIKEKRIKELNEQIAQENERREAIREAYYKKLQADIGTQMDKLSEEYTQSASELISISVNALKAAIDNELNKESEKNEIIEKAKKRIINIRSELDGIIHCIE